jgi:carboxyl-terminal processing protease
MTNQIGGQRATSRFMAITLVLVGFIAGFVVGQGSRFATAQDATPEPTAEATPEATATEPPAYWIPEEDHEMLYPVWQAYDLIRRGFLSPNGEGVSARGIVEGALEGMASRLNDPNSYYIPVSDMEAFGRRVSAQTVGIGITVNTNTETGDVFITSVVEPSPAFEAGILAGDIIVAINGEDVSDMAQPDIVQRAVGEEGTQITMTVDRAGEQIDFVMTRSVITRPVVSYQMLGDIGYIRIDQFAPNARNEMNVALESFKEAGYTGLIIDVRGNAGGTSGSMVGVASAFIAEGRIFTEDFGRRERVFEANGDLANVDVPLVILVNERSQSAAEALAGAIQDYDLGTIIGVPTFGKGTVQTVTELSNGGGFRFTIARVLTPSGDTYHAVGIQPDIVVEQSEASDDAQLEAALAYLMSGGQLEATPEATPEATVEAD